MKKKIGLKFVNTCDDFQISSDQQAFNNIVGAEGIIKIAYTSDNVEDNTEDSGAQ